MPNWPPELVEKTRAALDRTGLTYQDYYAPSEDDARAVLDAIRDDIMLKSEIVHWFQSQ